jgi:hypothetical protein
LTYQPPANITFLSEQTSHQQQLAVLFSQNKSAPAISHQPSFRPLDGEVTLLTISWYPHSVNDLIQKIFNLKDTT